MSVLKYLKGYYEKEICSGLFKGQIQEQWVGLTGGHFLLYVRVHLFSRKINLVKSE